MKKAILTTLVILSLTFIIFGMTLTVSAGEIVEGECGAVGNNLMWSLNTQTGTLTISGQGDMADYYNDYMNGQGGPWFQYRDIIKSIVIENGVTSIGNNAFLGIKGVKELRLPDSVLKIGNYAFAACTGLRRVNVGNGVQRIGYYAFQHCWNIYSLTLGNGVSEIDTGAFGDCRLLVEIYDLAPLYYVQKSTNSEVGHSLLSLFLEAHEQSRIVVDDNGFVFYVDEVESNYFLLDYEGSETDLVLPEYINGKAYAIKSCAFRKRDNLTSVKIPETIKYVEADAFVDSSVMEVDEYGVQYADKWLIRCPVGASTCIIRTDTVGLANNSFMNCNSLTEISIPDSVKHIGNNSFENCRYLKSVIIGDGVTRIGSYAFKSCTTLEAITIGTSVNSIGNEAFRFCDALNAVNIKDIANWCRINFNNISMTESNPLSFAGNLYLDGRLVTYLDIPETVESISDGAFMGATCIDQVNIPNTVTEIGELVFYGCENIRYMSIPFIGKNANDTSNKFGFLFSNGGNAYVPKSVTSVDLTACTQLPNNAFNGCASLRFVTLPETLTTISSSAFTGCHSLISIYIPSSITAIQADAFNNCPKLVEIINHSSLEFICGRNDYGQIALNALNIYQYQQDSKIQYVDDLIFYADKEKGDYILLAYIGSDTVVVLPEIQDGVTYSISPYAFAYNDNITSVTIPEGVTTIGYDVFAKCDNLVELSIPSSIESIGNGVFGSESLALTLHSNALYAGNDKNPYVVLVQAVSKDITSCSIHPDTKVIYTNAFSGCSQLESITIPRGSVSINYQAFYACYSLTEITLPITVKYVGDYAFSCCEGLKKIEIQNGDTELGQTVFYQCPSVETIIAGADLVIPMQKDAWFTNVSTIIINAGRELHPFMFDRFETLKTIVLPNNLEKVNDAVFPDYLELNFNEYEGGYYIGSEENPYMILIKYGNLDAAEAKIHKDTKFIYSSAFYMAENLKEIEIPDSVVSIGYAAFMYCASLESVKFGSGLTSIEMYAFSQCTALKEVELPDSLILLGYEAFSNCASLTKADLGNGIVTIEIGAFMQCTSIEEIFLPSSVAKIASSAFLGYGGQQFIKVISCTDISGIEIDGNLTITQHGYKFTYDDASHFATCKYCGATTSAADHVMGEGVITLDPTHDDAGTKLYVCECGYEVIEEIAAVGHNWDDGYIDRLPCHTYEGLMIYRCNCGAVLEEEIERTPEHEWHEGEVTTYPTHLEQGVLTVRCDCGLSYTEAIPKITDHEWGDAVVISEATHTNFGTVSYTCPCGEILTETIDKLLEHEWDEGTVTVEPSHTSEGTKMFSCPCGESYTEVISRIEEHEFGTWESISETMHRRSCICGAVEEQEHSMNGDACADCDYQIEVVSTEEPTLEHAKPEDGEVETDEPIKNDSQSGCSSSVSGVVVTLICGALAFTTLFDKKKKR